MESSATPSPSVPERRRAGVARASNGGRFHRVASSLVAQILAVFALVALTPLALSLAQIRSDTAQAEQETFDRARAASHLAAAQVAGLLTHTQGMARVLERLPRFWNGADSDRDEILLALSSSSDTFNALAYFTDDFQQHGISNQLAGQARPSLSSRAYARDAVASGRIAVTGEVLRPLRGGVTAILPVAIPLHESVPPGRRGFMAAGLKVDGLSEIWKEIALPEGSIVLLVDTREGHILSATSGATDRIGQSVSAEHLERLRAGAPTSRGPRVDGQESIIAYAPLADTPWVVEVSIPTVAVLEPIYADERQRILRNLLIAGFAFGLLVLLAHRLGPRLTALQVAATRWANGDWGHRANLRGGDEIAELGFAFDRMAARLQETLEQTRSIVNSAGEGIISVDRTGKAVLVNPAAARLTGHEADELLGQRPHFAIHHSRPDGTPYPVEECPTQRARRDGLTQTVADEVFWRKDGTSFPVEYVSTPIREGDEVVGAVIIFHDVTERRQAAEALRTAEEYLRMVLGNLPVVVYAFDRDGVFTLSDGAGLRSLGRQRGEVLGRSVFDVYREQPVITSGVRRALQGETVDVEVTVAGVTFDAQYIPVRRGSDEVEGVIGIATDVTARKKAERKLRTTLFDLKLQYREAELARGEQRAILDATSDGMLVVAPDGRVVSVNLRFGELFGQGPINAVGMHFDNLREQFERIFAESESVRATMTEGLADPTRRFTAIVRQVWPQERELELFSTPVRSVDGEPLGRLYAFRDVTRERAVDRMKSEFVALVSHELRTPLTSIKGYVDLLQDGEVVELSEEQREFLGIVKSNADRLVALINDLLDISRIESGKIELRRTSVNLRELIEHAATSMHPQIEAKGQQLTLDLPPTLAPVWGDQDRLTQIVANLLSNAHKYSHPEGQIRIGAAPDDGRVRISVQDTGIGMSEEEQSQLFTRFFRAQNRTTEEVGGTGLGLAITRSLVQMHGGEISVQSAPGQGSTFSFTIPSIRIQEAAPPRPANGLGVGRRILGDRQQQMRVADGDDTARAMLAQEETP